jgi:hypothetical protein
MVKFMQQGAAMLEMYCETLTKLRKAIQNKRSGILTSGVVLLRDDAHSHTATRTGTLLEHFNWELFDHSSYSPDLTSRDYHLFTYLKNWLGSQRFKNNELMEGVKTWLSSWAADLFDIDIQKFISQYDRCLSSSGHYLEK